MRARPARGPSRAGPASAEGARIRPGRRGDERELARLAAAVLPEAWPAEAFAATLGAESARARVAEAGGAFVGFALAQRAADAAEILSVAVAPVAQRKGLGRRLVEQLLADLRADGVARVHLEVRASNAAALGLYRSLGFRQTRRRARYYRDGEDALELGVAL